MKLNLRYKGFTLLEVILVVTLIGILFSIILFTVNPNSQLAQVRNSDRKFDIKNVYNALESYSSRNGGNILSIITTNYQEICDTGTRSITDALPNSTYCDGKIDLRLLVPNYIKEIPKDSQVTVTGNTGYEVAKSSANNQISIRSKNAELGDNIVINPLPPVIVLAGAKDPSFDTGIPGGFNNGNVYGFATQSDGKIIAVGGFTSYKGVGANGILRLNSDGSRDTSFNIGTGFDSSVLTLAVQTDGKIIVGGDFTTYQGVSANKIIRLNSDGSRDTSFNIGTGFSNWVNALAIQSDGKIIVGGLLSIYNGFNGAAGIIRLNSDGSRDTSFNIGTGFDSSVLTLAVQADGKIVVGGGFTTYQGVSVNRIIRLNSDGSRDTSFNIGTGFNSYVQKLTLQADGKILVLGNFITYQGVSANKIIRLNSDGSRDTSFNIGTGFDDYTFSIFIQSDGKIILGGGFTIYNGVSVNRIIRLNSDGSRDTSFNIGTGFNNWVRTIAVQTDGKIIGWGEFTNYQGVEANRMIRLNSDGSRDNSFNTNIISTGLNAGVFTLAVQTDGKIILGGSFTSYQEVGVNYIVRLNSDGSRDTSFNIGTGFDSSVLTLAVQTDGKIIVGGGFTSYNGVSANRIIRLNSDGSRDTSFNLGTGFDNNTRALVVQVDGKIVVGGGFTSYNGVSANRIIRLNSDGSRDTSFNMGTGFDSNVFSLAFQTDGKIVVGGGFTSYQGVSSNYIVRLNSDGSRDTSFNLGTGFNDSYFTISIQSDGKIITGGWFTTYNGVTANYIVRLNSDGSRDTSFNLGTGFDSQVRTIATQTDGKIIVGGYFTTYQSQPAGYLIRVGN